MQPCARVHAHLVHTCMHCCVAARTFQNPNRLIACSLRAAPGERQRLRSRLQGRAGRGRGDARRVPAGGADLSPLTSHFSPLTSHLSPLTSYLLQAGLNASVARCADVDAEIARLAQRPSKANVTHDTFVQCSRWTLTGACARRPLFMHSRCSAHAIHVHDSTRTRGGHLSPQP